MPLLTKAAILDADDLPTRDVAVPEWGGSVRIRAMTASQLDEMQSLIIHAKSDGMAIPENWKALHLALSVIDEKGKPVFTMADAAKLGAKSATAMNRVFIAINDLNTPGSLQDAAGN